MVLRKMVRYLLVSDLEKSAPGDQLEWIRLRLFRKKLYFIFLTVVFSSGKLKLLDRLLKFLKSR